MTKAVDATKHIIVQAGGKGTRLGYHTLNKPKCLVSVAGKPMLYHLFAAFPDAHFYIIGDYLFDVLEAYLQTNPPNVQYTLIQADGSGTCSGIEQARNVLPSRSTPFTLLWSDLYIPKPIHLDVPSYTNGLGVVNGLACRWSLDQEGELVESARDQSGVAGIYVIGAPEFFPTLPNSGELVRFLQQSRWDFIPFPLQGVHEIGTLAAMADISKEAMHSRYFNEVHVVGQTVIKRSRIPETETLIATEIKWYESVQSHGFRHTPQIRNRNPFTMDHIQGEHPFLLKPDEPQRQRILNKLLDAFAELHGLAQIPFDSAATWNVYYEKTWERLRKVEKMLPLTQKEFQINGRYVKNWLNDEATLASAVAALPQTSFCPIHGDPTFSNTLITPEENVVFIDPRGYFANHFIYGDPLYDYAKVYYSLVGNYDQFNRRQFRLEEHGPKISLEIPPSSWLDTEELFLEAVPYDKASLKLVHAVIWLALTGYVLDDIDSIRGSFYRGLMELEEVFTTWP